MSTSNEIGISPALLQAITQTISTSTTQAKGLDKACPQVTLLGKAQPSLVSAHSVIKLEPPASGKEGEVVPQDGGGGQRAIQAGNTLLILPSGAVYSRSPPAIKPQVTVVQRPEIKVASTEETVCMNQNGDDRHIVSISPNASGTVTKSPSLVSSGIPLSSHIVLKGENLRFNKSLPADSVTLTPVNSSTPAPLFTIAPAGQSTEILLPPQSSLPETTEPVTVDDKQVLITEAETVISETEVHTGPEVYIDTDTDTSVIRPTATKQLRIVEVADSRELGPSQVTAGSTVVIGGDSVSEAAVLKAVTSDSETVIYKTADGTPVFIDNGAVNVAPVDPRCLCPICGDRISGYHYGIYTCESCKGFFKRTVQNKKTFVCHKMGECVVSLANRKKCPACRFKRCIMFGMKLEAIREDRTRGGRSSYDGCSPSNSRGKSTSNKAGGASRHSSHGTAGTPRTITKPVAILPAPTVTTATIPPPRLPGHIVTIAGGNMAVCSLQAASDSTTSNSSSPSRSLDSAAQIQPHTPQLLEDLMAVESLMLDEEEQPCCEGKMTADDQTPFASLLHIADHCLYKIVRWARNLPDFATVTTDDQILLLQNCWAELLCSCCCWHSLRTEGGLKLSKQRMLSQERADAMGIGDVIRRLIEFSEALRRLEVDNYEFVSLKVLLLLSPDVKSLKDASSVRRQQDYILDALILYSSSNYPHRPNKVAELLARSSELTRTCSLAKEQLTQRQISGEIPPCSLLSELLKGDTPVVQS